MQFHRIRRIAACGASAYAAACAFTSKSYTLLQLQNSGFLEREKWWLAQGAIKIIILGR